MDLFNFLFYLLFKFENIFIFYNESLAINDTFEIK